ncbi:MAG: glycine cleavage T C-terminal barrel domain-containing protein [Deltaproteobacteria bacterium]|nr:glycine cleavage T C-terminal barrel domain-containing protein [Deltaproteobacteria bacterium]
MRTSPIRDLLLSRGAILAESHGVEVVSRFGDDVAAEYRAVRDAVGLTDFSFMTRHRVPEAGLDLLERYATGPVANIRFGRLLHTMAANEEGLVEADLYIANNDEELLVLGESLVGDEATAQVLAKLGGAEAGLEDLAAGTALIGIDGYQAFAVVKALFGPDVLGLPYLSIETYDLSGAQVRLMRAGKTSEFGYLLLVPSDAAAMAWERLERAGEPHGIRPVGMEAHCVLRLDGRFFNVHEEGRKVRDPLALGLQWMIDFGKEEHRGRKAIADRRAAGPGRKVVGVSAAEGAALEAGEKILHQGEIVAEVVTAAFSPTIGRSMGLALFERPYAYAGLSFETADGRTVDTISLPPFMPKSLGVKLDEM